MHRVSQDSKKDGGTSQLSTANSGRIKIRNLRKQTLKSRARDREREREKDGPRHGGRRVIERERE